MAETVPVVYTAAVGRAYEGYSRLPIAMHGLLIRPSDRGTLLAKVQAWAGGKTTARVVVVTDGERVFSLGDGMGMSEDKILLYTVIAGVDPTACMPVVLDVGTDHQTFLENPMYMGLRQRRLRGQCYDDLVEELLTACRQWNKHSRVQFEDSENSNRAFRPFEKQGPRQCCMQGTARITLAGLLATEKECKEGEAQTVLLFDAGESGTGIPLDKTLQAGGSRQCQFVNARVWHLACNTHSVAEKQRSIEGVKMQAAPLVDGVRFDELALDARVDAFVELPIDDDDHDFMLTLRKRWRRILNGNPSGNGGVPVGQQEWSNGQGGCKKSTRRGLLITKSRPVQT